MEMKKLSAGKLRAIGYDARARVLRVEFDDGSAIDYAGVGSDLWKRFSTSGVAWSFYRDNIEEEFSGTRGRATTASQGDAAARKPNPLDALFGTPGQDTDKT